MNRRQRRKVEKIKSGPWAERLWRGKAWNDSQQRWVRLWPDHPELQWLMDRWNGARAIRNALRRGRAHVAKRRPPPGLQSALAIRRIYQAAYSWDRQEWMDLDTGRPLRLRG